VHCVGLDCGGTKTECWIGDDRRVLAKAVTGTCKLMRVGETVASERLRGVIREALAGAGVRSDAIGATCMGIAGYTIAEVREWAARVLAEEASGRIELCGDEEIALDANFRGGPGILLIGGTGSAVIGRCADGTRYSAGGWGPAIGDEGSGFWIGREAVRQSLRAHDMGRASSLIEAVKKAWNLGDIAALVGFANERPGPDFAALTPVVTRCAADGDGVARAVLEQAGDELAQQVVTAWRAMQRHGEQSARVAYTGSVVEKVAIVRERVASALPAELRLNDGVVSSLEGALWRARRLASTA
jgi:glucosamine kinase